MITARLTSLWPGDWLARHWFVAFAMVYGLWVGTPFLAPMFMHVGWDGAARAVYLLYSFFCHQLPERSFFLFGPKAMYSLAQIQAAGPDSTNPFVLRAFIGNPGMGWKVAWSDRMISFYSSIWLFAVAWRIFRRGRGGLPWWGIVLLLAPIVLDGSSHAISDLVGIRRGFRDSNEWLRTLTASALPASFYAGDELGSFNSLMRLVTGVLAGLGIVWFGFPLLEDSLEQG